ncbi:MAG: CPBP family intramembrane glutamic endopeptidase [Chthoniobacterales bacterium]
MADDLPLAKTAVSQPGFWNKVSRLAIVRIVLGLLIIATVLTVLQLAFHAAAGASRALKSFFDLTALPIWLIIVALFVTYRAFVRSIEKRSPVELSARGAAPETALGISLGAAMFGLTIAILVLIGVFHVDGYNRWTVLVGLTAGAAISAVLEEIVFRGIIFRITEESLGSWSALAISALIFGAVHLLNPHTSLQGAVAIVLEAGIFLAAAYMTTRRLWLVIGAHFGWNFTESAMSAAVSGNVSHGLVKTSVTGPTYLTGGIFGVEASIVAVAVCLTAAILLLWRVRTKAGFIPPPWRRHGAQGDVGGA